MPWLSLARLGAFKFCRAKRSLSWGVAPRICKQCGFWLKNLCCFSAFLNSWLKDQRKSCACFTLVTDLCCSNRRTSVSQKNSLNYLAAVARGWGKREDGPHHGRRKCSTTSAMGFEGEDPLPSPQYFLLSLARREDLVKATNSLSLLLC